MRTVTFVKKAKEPLCGRPSQKEKKKGERFSYPHDTTKRLSTSRPKYQAIEIEPGIYRCVACGDKLYTKKQLVAWARRVNAKVQFIKGV